MKNKMKEIALNYRYHLLVVIAIVVAVGFLSLPNDDLGPYEWEFAFFVPRLIASVAAYIGYRLLRKWSAEGAIPELSRLTKEE